MRALVEMLAGRPLVASVAAAVGAGGLRAGKRRAAVNEALHELRRPMQALALAVGPGRHASSGLESSVSLAAAALERLDREINGGSLRPAREAVAVLPLLESAVARWRSRAQLAGGSLSLGWWAGRAIVEGDRLALSQAFDNLIVNAIEHGGPAIMVEARLDGDRLRVSVADSGRGSRPAARRDAPAEVIARLAGRSRRGHGLSVVRRIAAAHGGRFALCRSQRGSLAALELPLASAGPPAHR